MLLGEPDVGFGFKKHKEIQCLSSVSAGGEHERSVFNSFSSPQRAAEQEEERVLSPAHTKSFCDVIGSVYNG